MTDAAEFYREDRDQKVVYILELQELLRKCWRYVHTRSPDLADKILEALEEEAPDTSDIPEQDKEFREKARLVKPKTIASQTVQAIKEEKQTPRCRFMLPSEGPAPGCNCEGCVKKRGKRAS